VPNKDNCLIRSNWFFKNEIPNTKRTLKNIYVYYSLLLDIFIKLLVPNYLTNEIARYFFWLRGIENIAEMLKAL
jgi:hypothetical protein